MENEYLSHHGILGMKMGCKTIPEQRWNAYFRWQKKSFKDES